MFYKPLWTLMIPVDQFHMITKVGQFLFQSDKFLSTALSAYKFVLIHLCIFKHTLYYYHLGYTRS